MELYIMLGEVHHLMILLTKCLGGKLCGDKAVGFGGVCGK